MKRTTIFKTLVLTLMVSACGGSASDGIDTNMIPVGGGIYINKKGETVLQSDTNTFINDYFASGKAIASQKGLKGFVNTKGKFVIEPQYKNVLHFSESIAWVAKENGYPEAINTSGKSLFELKQAHRVYSFHDGLAVFESHDEEGNIKYGCVDKSGKVVIEPTGNKISNFQQGKAPYRNDDYKYGFINKEGKIVINCQFDEVQPFAPNGTACVQLDEKWGVINEKGEYIINPQYDGLIADGDWFIMINDGKMGWCDKTGKTIINPQFSDAFLFGKNDLAPVSDGKKWGYIDRKGTYIINPQFKYAFSFIDNNIAPVVLSEQLGFVDKSGKYVINPQYKTIGMSFVMKIIFPHTDEESLQSDYFDKTFITEALVPVLKNLANKYLRQPVGELLPVFSKSASDFKSYNKTQLLQEKKITSDITMKIYANDPMFKAVQKGWFTNKEFDPESSMGSFTCELECSGFAYDKTNVIFYTLLEIFNKITKEEAKKQDPKRGTYINLYNEASADDANIYVNGNKIYISMATYEG